MKNRNKRELLITLGFISEVTLFVLSGFFLAKLSLFAFVLFAAALLIAFAVGELIAKNARINYKDDN